MKISTHFLLPALLLLFAATGCSRYMIRPVPTYPTARVYDAGFEDVWKAGLESLRGIPLASIDHASGYIVTDWVKGYSDTRYVGTPERVDRWLEVNTKMTVSVAAVKGGTLVRVDVYEETNYPEHVRVRSDFDHPEWPLRRSLRRHHPSRLDMDRIDTVALDRWIPTRSSTHREKALLDHIAQILHGVR